MIAVIFESWPSLTILSRVRLQPTFLKARSIRFERRMIHRQIELAVKQAFPCSVSFLPESSAPKLRLE